ncbi:hypothetical protein [Falsiroseomonas oryzae]|uniref:hypothetical protein n=1 Tax=Falsiroseomonas oryzae TaxID=2766473 RepID=UPI0022EA3196|nr:hypothetical protein [Roseomonas sp. MO-31]
MHKSLRLVATVCALAAAGLPEARAATIGELDDFTSLTTENWLAGGGPIQQQPPVPPQAIPGGGPGGVADAYLQLTASGGAGPGSRLAVANAVQWAGNYLAAGITAITMDLRNFGTSDLAIRLQLWSPLAAQDALTAAVLLPAGGGWTAASFSVAAADLTMRAGTANGVLGDVAFLRILHAPGTAGLSPAEPVAAVLGVDNITSTGVPGGGGDPGVNVPEPSALLLLAGAIAPLAWLTRGRRPGTAMRR